MNTKTALAFAAAACIAMFTINKVSEPIEKGNVFRYRSREYSYQEEEDELITINPESIIEIPNVYEIVEKDLEKMLDPYLDKYRSRKTVSENQDMTTPYEPQPPEPTEEYAVIKTYNIPQSFSSGERTYSYTGTKTYESTDKITYGVAGMVNRAASHDSDGFMMVDGRYLVAIGTAFGIEPGHYFNLMLENGIKIPCIMGDTKADCDTDQSNMFTVHCKCATEFIVKINAMNAEDKKYGDVSKIKEGWDSRVVALQVLNKKWGEQPTPVTPEHDLLPEVSEVETIPEPVIESQEIAALPDTAGIAAKNKSKTEEYKGWSCEVAEAYR